MSKGNSFLLERLSSALASKRVSSFCQQLCQVVKRQGGFAKLARESSLNRESLYKALSGERDPRFSTIVEALSALGMRLRVELDKDLLEAELAGISGFEGAWLDLYCMSPKERLAAADRALATQEELSILEASNKSHTA